MLGPERLFVHDDPPHFSPPPPPRQRRAAVRDRLANDPSTSLAPAPFTATSITTTTHLTFASPDSQATSNSRKASGGGACVSCRRSKHACRPSETPGETRCARCEKRDEKCEFKRRFHEEEWQAWAQARIKELIDDVSGVLNEKRQDLAAHPTSLRAGAGATATNSASDYTCRGTGSSAEVGEKRRRFRLAAHRIGDGGWLRSCKIFDIGVVIWWLRRISCQRRANGGNTSRSAFRSLPARRQALERRSWIPCICLPHERFPDTVHGFPSSADVGRASKNSHARTCVTSRSQQRGRRSTRRTQTPPHGVAITAAAGIEHPHAQIAASLPIYRDQRVRVTKLGLERVTGFDDHDHDAHAVLGVHSRWVNEQRENGTSAFSVVADTAVGSDNVGKQVSRPDIDGDAHATDAVHTLQTSFTGFS